MIGDIKQKYCPICDENTDHLQGTFKCKEINGDLCHLNSTLSDSLRKLNSGYKDFVLDEKDGNMNSDSPYAYAVTQKGGLNFEEFFASQVRSLKCTKCLHLIKIARLP